MLAAANKHFGNHSAISHLGFGFVAFASLRGQVARVWRALAMGKEGEAWVVMKTARAPSNIAVIKYWGKRDEKLILPINSSISVTLDPQHLSATTTVSASPAFESDRLWLNGKVGFR